MEAWLVSMSIVFAAVFVARAIDKSTEQKRLLSEQIGQQNQKSYKVNTVATIAGSLISAMLANPKYWEEYEAVLAERIGAIFDQSKSIPEREEVIDEIDDRHEKMNVFKYAGRRYLIELAYQIHEESSSVSDKHE